MIEGLITKALSGFYYVMPLHETGQTYQCRGRGILKLKGQTPLVGDRVLFEVTEHGEGVINELLPRSSELIRPPVANVDLVIVVFSIVQPALHLALLDKFLAHTAHAGLETFICITKSDLEVDSAGDGAGGAGAAGDRGGNGRDGSSGNGGQSELQRTVQMYEQIGYRVFVTSALEGDGLERLKASLKGRIAVLSGQSGVGKSSLLNALVPNLNLDTGEVSEKLARGRHTTRHVELIPLPNGGVVADAPGFSQLDFSQFEPEDLSAAFIEFAPYTSQCKFRDYLHQQEPQCSIIAAVESGAIAKSRYNHYLQFLEEIKMQERRY